MKAIEKELSAFIDTDETLDTFVKRMVREALLEAAGICDSARDFCGPGLTCDIAAKRIRALAGGEEPAYAGSDPRQLAPKPLTEMRVREIAAEIARNVSRSFVEASESRIERALSSLTIRSEAAISGDDGGETK